MSRTAEIHFGVKGDKRAVVVSHPGRLTPKDVASINKQLVEKVIHDLTGCTCMSGTIDVIWQTNFENVIRVNLEAAGAPMRV